MDPNSNRGLKGLLDNEIRFLASPSEQKDAWRGATGPYFVEFLKRTGASWDAWKKHRTTSSISDRQFQMLEKLFGMLWEFLLDEKHPTRPSEYEAILCDPRWKAVQKQAMEVYSSLRQSFETQTLYQR